MTVCGRHADFLRTVVFIGRRRRPAPCTPGARLGPRPTPAFGGSERRSLPIPTGGVGRVDAPVDAVADGQDGGGEGGGEEAAGEDGDLDVVVAVGVGAEGKLADE